MANMSKEELEAKEKEFGITDIDSLTHQERVKQVKEAEKNASKPKRISPVEAAKQHPMYGKTILITPLMRPNAKQNLAFDEVVGHEIEVQEYNAGDDIYHQGDTVDHLAGDYKIIREDKSRPVIAKTTFPKIGTEITYTLGRDLVPIVRGNDGSRGYLWAYPPSTIQVEDTLIQIMGLRTMIEEICPELLPEFSGKPMMSYIDGVTLAASIPLTDALLKKWRMNERKNAAIGLL